jgi:hypothetical protein
MVEPLAGEQAIERGRVSGRHAGSPREGPPDMRVWQPGRLVLLVLLVLLAEGPNCYCRGRAA